MFGIGNLYQGFTTQPYSTRLLLIIMQSHIFMNSHFRKLSYIIEENRKLWRWLTERSEFRFLLI
jgi:hypothetical protein